MGMYLYVSKGIFFAYLTENGAFILNWVCFCRKAFSSVCYTVV